MRPISILFCCIVMTPLAWNNRHVVGEPRLPVFTDVTTDVGIRFRHSFGDRNLSNIVEGTGAGCAFFDYNGDGFQDIYFVNGCWLQEVSDNRGRDLRGKLANALYRNNRDGTFSDVTEDAGVGHRGYGSGVSAADYDGDGDLDLYLLNYGRNVLFRNDGDGTFTDVSEAAGLADPHWSLSAPWLDFDGDGDLDVYVANYLEYDDGEFRDFYAAAGYPGPLSYDSQPDRLYRNNGDGTFTDVTDESGVVCPNGRAMSAATTDFNGDGILDIYVANDATPNCYFVGNGRGKFREVGLDWGVAFAEGGQAASSMGPVIGDVNGDGRLDAYIPDMGYGCLLINEGDVFFDKTATSRLAAISGQYTGWGGALLDYDNDGHLDIFVANGNAHHEYSEEDVLVRNNGKGQFIDVANSAGAYFREKYVGRGVATADYDNDGDVDILVINLNGPAKLLRNDGGNRNQWLRVAPRYAGTKVEVIGTRVTVHAGNMTLLRQVSGAMGYLSYSDTRLHFGLGNHETADEVEIRWPDGNVIKLTNIKANRLIEVFYKPK